MSCASPGGKENSEHGQLQAVIRRSRKETLTSMPETAGAHDKENGYPNGLNSTPIASSFSTGNILSTLVQIFKKIVR